MIFLITVIRCWKIFFQVRRESMGKSCERKGRKFVGDAGTHAYANTNTNKGMGQA
jgi:hypothetical protein